MAWGVDPQLVSTATSGGLDSVRLGSTEGWPRLEDDAGLPPDGFAETTADGLVVSDDEDDWRTAPIFFGKIRIDPAYPNPSFGQFITVPVSIQEFNGVQGGIVLRAEDGDGALRLIDELLNTNQPGAYTLRFSPAVLGRAGLVRVFLFDRLGELISYGDVSIR